MIPFEGLLPIVSRLHSNDGKKVRYNLDRFDRQMMERDFRLTGKFREQIDNAVAPESFKTNSAWKLEKSSWFRE
ncbi:hypothetical protein WICMUC_000899 [Wickerhamomyces mucosus]|uniref:NADH dehydrogenase [ubiquinone] 1 alpha subcomplex subunit 1 n=1 Tax=Wickerhamomyces mucosus TaxID=1378264 RepID=A0A9P8TIF9_9ASCO|nr:hypothetical protein WICMUC_000899 [Wickerhamomyces mucosus]